MWQSQTQALPNRAGERIVVSTDAGLLSFADVLVLWRTDQAFRSFFISVLADAAFAAYRWETPPVTTATTNRDFEFVLLDCPGLARTPDPNAFASHFHSGRSGDLIVTFSNLGNDAILVVPASAGPQTAYGHLAAFIREAPDEQKHALWIAVSDAMQSRLNHRPVWLSTAGMGVSWLHVRLDDRPKYYGYRPYTQN